MSKSKLAVARTNSALKAWKTRRANHRAERAKRIKRSKAKTSANANSAAA